jgi:hypothetical protein
VRYSKAQVERRVHAIPEVEFEDERLSSAAGLVVFQGLIRRLKLRSRLRQCFRHVRGTTSFSSVHVVLLLVVHVLLGYRKLRELEYYRDDPVVLRLLGLSRLPDVSTLSRRLGSLDRESCRQVGRMSGELVRERLAEEGLRRVTLDFDGSVVSTRRQAEGTAVGFNRKRKGTRSYYPLFCTVSQTGQVLDVLHRSGNVHDFNGAPAFIAACVGGVQGACRGVQVEARMDAAFFSQEAVELLERLRVEYSISVPFGGSPALKEVIEARQRWRRIDETWSYFELRWRSVRWKKQRRFVVYRQRVRHQRKGALQLDLYEPVSWTYQYKVVVTNKKVKAAQLLRFHNGRGAQEGVLGEIKDLCQLSYIPSRSWAGNQMYMQAGILAHNLTRELQMQIRSRDRTHSPQRSALWRFEKLSTIRHLMICRAGRLINRAGHLVLRMSANQAVQRDLQHMAQTLKPA